MAALTAHKRTLKGRSAFLANPYEATSTLPESLPDPTQALIEQQLFHCNGSLFGKFRSIDPEDYFDFYFKTWSRLELLSDLRLEVLPQGTLLHTPSGQLRCILESKLIPFEIAPAAPARHLLR